MPGVSDAKEAVQRTTEAAQRFSQRLGNINDVGVTTSVLPDLEAMASQTQKVLNKWKVPSTRSTPSSQQGPVTVSQGVAVADSIKKMAEEMMHFLNTQRSDDLAQRMLRDLENLRRGMWDLEGQLPPPPLTSADPGQ